MTDSLKKLAEEISEARAKMDSPDTVYIVGGRMLESWAARLDAMRERLLKGTPQTHSEWPTALEELAILARSIAGEAEEIE